MTSLNQAIVEAGGSWSKSFGSNVGSTDTLFAVVTGYNNTNVVITSSAATFDGTAGTGTQAPVKILEKLYPYDGNITDYVAVWMLPPPAGGWPAFASLAVTVTNSQSISNVGIIGIDIAGLGTLPTVDRLVTADGFTTSPSSGATAATRFANEFVLGVIVQDQNQSTAPGAPWSTQTATGGDTNSIASYVLPVSAGSTYTYSDTASPAARWAAGVVTVYAGSAAAAPPRNPARPARGRQLAARGRGRGLPGRYTAVPVHRTLLISLASMAGTDDYGNAFPQGIYAAAGVIEGPEFIGADFIITAAGLFFYSGTPAAGNLIMSVTPSTAGGTDQFGNHYVPLNGQYDNSGGFFTQSGAGFVTFGTGSLAGGWTANSSIQNDSSGNLYLGADGDIYANGNLIS